jgi:hypothetical protein
MRMTLNTANLQWHEELTEAWPAVFCVWFPNQRQGKHPITNLNSRLHVGLLRTFILLLGICQIFPGETIVVGWSETDMCARIVEMAAKDFTSHGAFNFKKHAKRLQGHDIE